MNPLGIALLSIGLSVAAQFLLKSGVSEISAQAPSFRPFSWDSVWLFATEIHILSGLLLYGLGAVAWMGVLAQWDVSKAYPFVGLGFAATLVIGTLAGEQVTAMRSLGVILICAGVFLVGRT